MDKVSVGCLVYLIVVYAKIEHVKSIKIDFIDNRILQTIYQFISNKYYLF